MRTGGACIARLEPLSPSGATHQEIELVEFLDHLVWIAGTSRTGALGLAVALVDPRRRLSDGWVSIGTSQLVRYSRGDKEAVTKTMRRFVLAGIAEEIQFPSLAEHRERQWRVQCPWQHREAWAIAAESAQAEIPRDGRKFRLNPKRGVHTSPNQRGYENPPTACVISASLPTGTSIDSLPSSSIGEREEGEGEINSELERERQLLVQELCSKFVNSAAWAHKAVQRARNPGRIRIVLPELWLEASRNARPGKDGAGLLLHWVETGQADARAERLTNSARSIDPTSPPAQSTPSPRPNHDPAALQVWEPILAEILPCLVPPESIRAWLVPLTAEGWDGVVLQLRADSESAYLWITQQLEEELNSTGVAIKILPPKGSHLPQGEG